MAAVDLGYSTAVPDELSGQLLCRRGFDSGCLTKNKPKRRANRVEIFDEESNCSRCFAFFLLSRGAVWT